jgi:hypothetical protein
MAAITPTGGSALNSVPSPIKAAISTNYLETQQVSQQTDTQLE